MNELTQLLITTAISFATGIAGWLASKKRSQAEINKLKAEINGNELDNVEKAVKIWRDLAEDLTQKLKAITERCEQLEREMDLMITENKSLKEQLQSLTATIERLNGH